MFEPSGKECSVGPDESCGGVTGAVGSCAGGEGVDGSRVSKTDCQIAVGEAHPTTWLRRDAQDLSLPTSPWISERKRRIDITRAGWPRLKSCFQSRATAVSARMKKSLSMGETDSTGTVGEAISRSQSGEREERESRQRRTLT